jgi:hypothetical protein
MGTGSFPGVKRPGRAVHHPPPYSAEVKERLELYLYSTSGRSWAFIGRTLVLALLEYIYLLPKTTLVRKQREKKKKIPNEVCAILLA